MLDFSFDSVEMDAYGDSGAWGSLGGLRRTRTREVLGDVLAELDPFDNEQYRDRLDRSVVARLGVMCTLGQEWDGAGAAAVQQLRCLCCPSSPTISQHPLIGSSAPCARVRSVSKCEQGGIFSHSLDRVKNEDPQVGGGARGESRTPTPFRAPDPKSGASTVPPLSRRARVLPQHGAESKTKGSARGASPKNEA